jgi:D-lyxose ketol-isomerase
MITETELANARAGAVQLIRAAGITASEEELKGIEVADFGLGHLRVEGAQILTLVATERIGVKVLALTPDQTLPEHWHPQVGDDPGKEETIRVVYGEMSVVSEGPRSMSFARLPAGKEEYYTCTAEARVAPGDQITFSPGQKHWFQAGADGAVAYSFSTVARDVLDGFTDPEVDRVTKVIPG